jgi:hypothetical protein
MQNSIYTPDQICQKYIHICNKFMSRLLSGGRFLKVLYSKSDYSCPLFLYAY